jgi:hypothetical protein
MEKQKATGKKDTTLFALIVGVAGLIFVFTSGSLGSQWRTFGITFFFFCFVVAFIGSARSIGFGGAFFASFFLSPVIGLIITLTSSKIKDGELKEKMLEAAEKTNPALVADQLYKLNELRKEGVLTDEEFNVQKEKLLFE